MIRQIRRTLRGWKREVASVWAKFNTFYRIVIGIVIAMGIIYGGRQALLDPQQKELKTLTEKLSKDSVPEVVSSPDFDDEVQQYQLKSNSTKDNIKEFTTQLKEAEKKTNYRLNATIADASTEIIGLASQRGLLFIGAGEVLIDYETKEESKEDKKETSKKEKQKSKEDKIEEDTAKTITLKKRPQVPIKAMSYELRGDFSAISVFLKTLNEIPFIWRIKGVSISQYVDDNGRSYKAASGGLLLSLRFNLFLYQYKGDGK